MTKFKLFFLGLIILGFALFFFNPSLAEEKMDFSRPDGGGIIPKIAKTANDPILRDGGVYPMWGPVCQRYTYHTIYQDKQGRPPEYVRMFFNGKWITVEKENPNDNDYKKGVRYVYKFVPNKLGSNFFFFEASNGLGKMREGIIDSPGNGPVLFEGDFLDNEIALIDAGSGKKLWKFPTKEEWVGAVAISDDGSYLAAQTSNHIYFFDTKSAKPLWDYGMSGSGTIGGDVKGGVAISSDGTKVFASLGNAVYLFNKSSGQPIWQAQSGNNSSYNVAISEDGKYMAAATAGSESDQNSNLLILWNEKSSTPLWQYHASGNFHDVSLSANGQYVVAATGCPDRRAYIFSKESNQPLVKSEMLTYDSPVNTSRISADGSLAYFSTDGGPKSSVLALFTKNSNSPVWKFDDGINESARAMEITTDGRYAAVANMNGDVYLLGKDKNLPLKKWKINATTGALDIPDDASFVAVGGTDNKVHIIDINSQKQKEVAFDEYLVDVAVSKNGKYIAAGTGGSIYFFESFTNENKIFPCATIVEPKPMSKALEPKGSGEQTNKESLSPDNKKTQSPKIVIFSGVVFLGSILLLAVYFFLSKLHYVKYDKRITIGLLVLTGLLFIVVLTLFLTKKPSNIPMEKIDQKNTSGGVCGNSLCEPRLGEDKSNCPKDCTPP